MHRLRSFAYAKVTIIWSKQVEPFYMTFPMQNLFQAELEYEKDLERMREMYPREVLKIAEMVSDRCDELEFEGSRIYDENPDRMMMAREAQTLYEKIKKELGLEEQSDRLTENPSPVEAESVPEEAGALEASGYGMADPGSREERTVFSLRPPGDWNLPGLTDAGCGPECGGEPLWQPAPPSPPEPPQPPQPWGAPGPQPAPPKPWGAPPPQPQPPQPWGAPPPKPQPRQAGQMAQASEPDGCNDWLCSVVGILLSNEIYKRRCRYRRSRRWW
jgi:hypothetical protein